MPLLKNYQNDLLKSRTTPLLIELSNENLNKFGKDGLDLSLFTAQKIYDIPIKDEDGTNLILIDGNKVKNKNEIFIFEELLTLLEPQIKKIKNLVIVKKGVTKIVFIATGGVVDGLLGGVLDSGLEIALDSIHGTIYDILIDTSVEYLDIPNKIISEIDDRATGTINDSIMELIDVLDGDEIYLTHDARQQLEELSTNFKKELSAAASFRLIIQLILSMAIKMPKIIFVNNPHKLDKNSLAILSLLYSYSKDLKDEGKHCGVSVIYAYSDKEFQPYEPVAEVYNESKQLLDEQRLYTQRYAMLERPTSDIPRIAVKSHMFVGREEELKSLDERYFYSKQNKTIATLETVSGEPGIGKTKLIKKHLHNIRTKEELGAKMIQLSLLNQVGHSSSNTGLSSLIDSIVKESARLESVKTFTEVVIDKAKEFAKDSVTSYIKNVLGVDKLIDMVEVVDDSVFLGGRIEQTLDNTRGDQDNKSSDKKQQQFIALTMSIQELRDKLSDESMPIVLFIDDLQWLDEDSAEYILEHFIKNFNIHIVSSIRPSDATTMLSKIYANKEQYPYIIALLTKAGIKLEEEINIEINTRTIESNATHLLGLDTSTLTSLISQVIKPINKDDTKQSILAKTIIKELNNDKSKDEVNTLFAVETINMLCDRKFYFTKDKDGNKLAKVEPQLILTAEELKFNHKISNDDIEIVITDTFKKLLRKDYVDAFMHNNAKGKDLAPTFNLMAYAVLEERLNILKIYFGDHGNAAVNTLLFSSLLGTPFNSTIVKNILQKLSTTKEKSLEDLQKYITKDTKETTLTEAHYEIIEEVYEILSKYVAFNSSYEYRHSLLNIFLDKQLEYQLDKVFIEKRQESKDNLYLLILTEINKEDKKQDFYGEEAKSLETKEYENMLFFKIAEQNILRVAYSNHKDEWIKDYSRSLNNMMRFYYWTDNISQSIVEGERLISILSNDTKLESKYVLALSNLAMTYKANNNLIKAVELQEYAKKTIEENNLDNYKNLDHWIDYYMLVLTNLATIYKNNKNINKAINLEEKAFQILESNMYNKSEDQLEVYLRVITNLANSYMKRKENDDIDKAKLLIEKAGIIDELYKNKPDRWINHYSSLTQTFSNILSELKYSSHALDTLIALESEVEAYYDNNKKIWRREYIFILNNITSCYLQDRTQDINLIIKYEMKCIQILENLPMEEKDKWNEIYVKRLMSLGSLYFFKKDFQNAYSTYSSLKELKQLNSSLKKEIDRLLNEIISVKNNSNYLSGQDIYPFANYLAYKNQQLEIVPKNILDAIGFMYPSPKLELLIQNLFKDSNISIEQLKYEITDELMDTIASIPRLAANDHALAFINILHEKFPDKSMGVLR